MAPPNLTDATAIEITSWPYTVTTDPENNTNELWYTFVATSAQEPAMGFHSYGTGTYRPWINVKSGTLGAETDYLGGYYATRKFIVVPVTGGVRYWIIVSGGTGSTYSAGNTFTLRGLEGPTETAVRGSLLITDDTPGFPAIVLERSTGEVLRYVDLPASEQGDSLRSGHILTEDLDNINDLKLYNGHVQLVATLAGLASGTMRIRSNGGSLFYTSNGTTLKSVTTTGAIGNTWTLAATPIALAPARDNGILYYASAGATAVIRRWDLVGNAALTNLAAGITNYFVGDMFVLVDGTILVQYLKSSGGVDHFLRRYNTDGSTAQDYAFGTSVIDHLGWSDDDAYIWVWTQASGQGTFKEMALATGSFRETFSQYDYLSGVSEEAATATPQEFGHSFSCPLMAWLGPLAVTVDESEPCCPCDCPPAPGSPGGPGPGGSPSTAPLPSHTGDILPPVSATWTPNCTGGGDVPTAADVSDAESWVS